MRFDPAEPSTSSGEPSSRTTVGAIIDGRRRPGGGVKNPAGERSCSPLIFLPGTPVPGPTTPDPSPLVVVTAHAQPSASSTLTCVVEPSRDVMNVSRNPG